MSLDIIISFSQLANQINSYRGAITSEITYSKEIT